MFKKKLSANKLTLSDPVYSGRNLLGIWDYIISHGSNIERYFDGIHIPRERILNENEWFDIHTTTKLWENYRKCLPDFDMTETFNISLHHIKKSTYGIAKLVTQFSSLKTIYKLSPYLASTVSKIDLLDILELKNNSAIIQYTPYPGFEKFIDSSHIFSILGTFSSFPTVHNLPLAKVQAVATFIDVFNKFNIDFSQFGHEIEEKDGVIYLDGESAGKWITISRNFELHPAVLRYLSGERCVLWEKDVKEKKKAGHEVLIAKKGDLYNCSKSLYVVGWENSNFTSRLKNAIPFLKQYVTSFFKSRESLVKQTSLLQNRTNILNARVKEKTDELTRLHNEISDLEKRSIENQITGGFAHEMRNALAGAQLELKLLTDDTDSGAYLDSFGRNISSFSNNLDKIVKNYNIPNHKIESGFLPPLKKLDEIKELLSTTMQHVSVNVNTGLDITNQIRDYAIIHELKPGSDLIDLYALLASYQSKFQDDFEKFQIHYTVTGPRGISIKAGYNHLDSIFVSLILNAKQALRNILDRNRKIEVELEIHQADICVRIKDNGSGIETEHKNRIFEPFFTTNSRNGAGLGLSIVQRLAGLYGGNISFETKIKHGTVFKLNLPLMN